MEKGHFKKRDAFILGVILLVALALRLYKINAPLTDFHSWRQADTAAVARNFTRDGFNLFMPKYDDLSSIQSGLENPQGLRFVEFPLYNAMFAGLNVLVPAIPLEVWGRIVSIFFSLVVIAIIYYLALAEFDRTAAIFAALLVGILPASVFFSRVVLPETTAAAFAFIAILLMYLQPRAGKAGQVALFLFSVLFFAGAVMIKPTAIFYGFPVFYLFVTRHKFAFIRRPDFYLYFILALLPFVLWRLYIAKFPEGVPASEWLLTSVNTYAGQKVIFLKPAFFRWIFWERINLMIFGGYLTGFFLLGLFTKIKRLFLHSILFSAFAYVFVFEGGNVQHEYYQTIIIPALALFAGIGISVIVSERKRFLSPLLTVPLILGAIALSVSFSYYYKVKDFYTYPQDLNHMAKILDTFTRPTDKVITDRLGDTTLLYLADRKGAPMLYRPLDQLKAEGYAYYMTDKKEIISELITEKKYPVLFENSQFALFKL